MSEKEKLTIIEANAENVAEIGVFCIKDSKADGFKNKIRWFQNKKNQGITIKIAMDENNKQIGFIEYISSELAWRPINIKNYLFIQCITVFSKKMRSQGIASDLIKACELDALKLKKDGICTMSSKGSWIADKPVFTNYGFQNAESKGRFELLYKSFDNKTVPTFFDWTAQQKNYKGWNLTYANQCPWHAKSVQDLIDCSTEHGINLKVKEIKSPAEAQNAPSGYGVFNLIKDGKLLSDHYISRTRFENIIKKEI